MKTAGWRGGMLVGTGAVAGATVTALILAGTGGTTAAPPSTDQPGGDLDLTPVRLTVPQAAENELPGFESCEELRQWYVDRTLPEVTAWGLGPRYYPMYESFVRRDAMPQGGIELDGMASDGATTSKVPEPGAVGSSETGTNVQEVGVDEPDVAKTNGEVVVRVRDGRVVVIDVSDGAPRVLSSVALPKKAYDGELLIDGDKVLVFANEGDQWGYPYWDGGDVIMDRSTIMPPMPQPAGATRMMSIDISDPADAEVLTSDRLDGELVSARSYPDGTVRVVISTGYPPLDFVQPNRDRTTAQAKAANRQIVEEATIDQWLPQVTDVDGTESPLLDCTDVRHPKVPSGFGTVSVLTLPDGDPTLRTTTGVTAAGSLVYSSTERLYIATTEGGDVQHEGDPRLQVNAFAINGTQTTYVAAGTVEGTVKDRWSFDEYDGRLRVATALGNGWTPREHGVTVLEDDGKGRLVEVGAVAGMGKGEDLKSVRWFGDLAVLVTFRQVDPLYSVDLSEPAEPRVVGELKIPGFSSYLHPVSEGRLLGVGQDATMSGMTRGGQAATYDISDPTSVVQEEVLGFGPGTEPTVESDPRSFTYLPDRQLALIAVHSWGKQTTTRLVAVRVGDDGTLTEIRSWAMATDWFNDDVRTLPLDDGKVALVGQGVRVIDLD